MSDMFFFSDWSELRPETKRLEVDPFRLNPWYLVGCQVAERVEKTKSKEEANGFWTGFFRGLGVGVLSENGEVGKLECKSLYHIFSYKEEWFSDLWQCELGDYARDILWTLILD